MGRNPPPTHAGTFNALPDNMEDDLKKKLKKMEDDLKKMEDDLKKKMEHNLKKKLKLPYYLSPGSLNCPKFLGWGRNSS
jgi:hypothetical protein